MKGNLISRRSALGMTVGSVSAFAFARTAGAASLSGFNPADHIAECDAWGAHSFVLYRNGKRVMYCHWHLSNSDDPNGVKFDAFIDELHRQQRAFDLLDGESVDDAHYRVHSLLKHANAGKSASVDW